MEKKFNSHKKKIIFIAWADHARRSYELSKRIKCKFYQLKKMTNNKYLSIFSYIRFIYNTVNILIHEKPDLVFIEYTQPFIGIVVYIYSKLSKVEYILDAHSGPFISKRYKLLKFWQKILIKNSKVTIIHNDKLKHKIKKQLLLDKFFTLEDPIPIFAQQKKHVFDKKRKIVTVINTFSIDEPIENVIRCAKLLPQINFIITGNLKKDSKKISKKIYSNVKFTGFIDDKSYIDIVNSADVVIVLTSRDYTLLCGGYEALSLERPLITSDKEPLREYYSQGVLFTDNRPDNLKIKVLEAIGKRKVLEKQMSDLKLIKEKEWNIKFNKFRSLI